MTRRAFPNDFVWGVATSAYQIEGATLVDGRGPSIWDTFCALPGAVLGGEDGSVACEHYTRWPADLDLIAGLGMGAYRFSVSWPRVVPEGRGRVNPGGLDFYERLVDGMLERGIAPYCTLYHWDLPQALEDEGGWTSRDTAHAFAAYAGHVAERLGDRIRGWFTLNEPWCSAYLGYGVGVHAPGIRDTRSSLQAAHHLLLGHGLAMGALRAAAPAAQHGVVLNLFPIEAERDVPEDHAAARRHDAFVNRWYLDPVLRGRYPADAWKAYGDLVPTVAPDDARTIAAAIDVLGVNYYHPIVVRHAPDRPFPLTDEARPAASRTAMGWEVR
ncbi:MAG: family 1 glycosylhydrolase, partial [Trueperaceae bacterium]|nr:family 1 glycosylhydrolase [Trueperaceae bacterium]